jgi:hypothetical protein
VKTGIRNIYLVLFIALGIFLSACSYQGTTTSTTTATVTGTTTTFTSPYFPPTVTVPTTITVNTCTPTATTTVTPTATVTTTVTLPMTTSTGSVQFTLPDEGIINLAGVGYFYFQRISQPITAPISFHGVTFTQGGAGPGTTITAPISYWIIAKFQDGTTEDLRYIGLGDTKNININVTMHGNPRAGVLQGWQQVNGSLRNVIYILVNE